MSKEFGELLDDTIDAFLADGGDINDVVSALELKLMALKEEQTAGEDEP